MCDATVLDISEGGLRIQSAESFPINSTLNVFVQFPGGGIHLQARVVRTGGGPPTIALAFMRGNTSFSRAYEKWVAEVRETLDDPEAPGAGAKTPDPTTVSAVGSKNAPNPMSASPTEPKSPVRRRLETRQGNAYEVLVEKNANAWTLTIFPSPREPHVTRPEFTGAFADYCSADEALREFLRAH